MNLHFRGMAGIIMFESAERKPYSPREPRKYKPERSEPKKGLGLFFQGLGLKSRKQAIKTQVYNDGKEEI